MFDTVIGPLSSVYASHNIDLITDVLILMLLLLLLLLLLSLLLSVSLHAPLDSWFYSTQFLDLNLEGWFVVLSNGFIIFDIPLLYYYINLK